MNLCHVKSLAAIFALLVACANAYATGYAIDTSGNLFEIAMA